MKKILIIGDNLHSKELIDVAKANGVHTVITDNKAFVESQSKKIADEYWDISVTDINELEKKAKEEGIDGITCGASELCLATVRELCKRLRLPFWIDDNAWEIINNKKRFKELCRECGLPVAKDYKLDISFKQVDLEKIEYPVIVKPADGSSSIGVHVCTNEKELKEGYQDAYSSSKQKKLLLNDIIRDWKFSFCLHFMREKLTWLQPEILMVIKSQITLLFLRVDQQDKC